MENYKTKSIHLTAKQLKADNCKCVFKIYSLKTNNKFAKIITLERIVKFSDENKLQVHCNNEHKRKLLHTFYNR